MIEIRSLADVEFPINSDGLYFEKEKEGVLRTTFRFNVDPSKVSNARVDEVVRLVCNACTEVDKCEPAFFRSNWFGFVGDLKIKGRLSTTRLCPLKSGMIPQEEFEK